MLFVEQSKGHERRSVAWLVYYITRGDFEPQETPDGCRTGSRRCDDFRLLGPSGGGGREAEHMVFIEILYDRQAREKNKLSTRDY